MKRFLFLMLARIVGPHRLRGLVMACRAYVTARDVSKAHPRQKAFSVVLATSLSETDMAFGLPHVNLAQTDVVQAALSAFVRHPDLAAATGDARLVAEAARLRSQYEQWAAQQVNATPGRRPVGGVA